MSKLNWNNLTSGERAEYMRLQMSPQGSYDRTGYLPDDCGECGACGTPILGGGWCQHCLSRYRELRNKLEQDANDESAKTNEKSPM